jgi:spore maturation protein CgeB
MPGRLLKPTRAAGRGKTGWKELWRSLIMDRSMLILGEFGSGAIEHFFLKGFERCGIRVTTFDIAEQYYIRKNKNILNKVLNKISPDIFYREMNVRLVSFLDKKKFDIILVFKGMQLFPGTVKQLKAHATVLANYNGDHPFIYYTPGSGNKNVLDSIPLYDVHFSYARSITEKLKTVFGKDAFCIPFGFNARGRALHAATAAQYQGRFLFIGAYDRERAAYLDRVHADDLDIYGDNKWRTRTFLKPYIQKAYRNRALYDKDYSCAIQSSSGILNLLRKQNIAEDSHNMRTFEVPGHGGLLISQRTGEQCDFFEEGREAVYFETQEELCDKLKYLSGKDAEISSMKQAALQRAVRSNYSYDHRSEELLNCLENYL